VGITPWRGRLQQRAAGNLKTETDCACFNGNLARSIEMERRKGRRPWRHQKLKQERRIVKPSRWWNQIGTGAVSVEDRRARATRRTTNPKIHSRTKIEISKETKIGAGLPGAQSRSSTRIGNGGTKSRTQTGRRTLPVEGRRALRDPCCNGNRIAHAHRKQNWRLKIHCSRHAP
jgi:hypothetical protein